MSKVNGFISIYGSRHLNKTLREESKSTQKLSSGKRINSATDDAAGLGISQKLKASARSKGAAIRNANDAVSILQTIEGGLQDFNSLVVRIKELTVHSASDTVTDRERQLMQMEVTQSLMEIDRLAQVQEMFGKKITNGGDRRLDIQVDIGGNKKDRIQIDLENLSHTSLALGIANLSVANQRSARNSMVKVDFAINEISKSMARIGALSSRFGVTINKLQGDVVNTKQANSRIEDADYAQESANKVKNNIEKDGQTAVLAQANNELKSALRLID